jgi:hypothetical protein
MAINWCKQRYCLCAVTQLPVITPKQDGELCATLIDAVGQPRFIR